MAEISGYTAKVAGTEMGVAEPSATFSACFGAAFLVWHPEVYARLLAEKIREHGARVWLVNTGWSGGVYGVGSRMKLKYTRAIIDAIHDGSLEKEAYQTDPIFGFQIPQDCAGVPTEILDPANTWKSRESYRQTALKLAILFQENFKKFEAESPEDIRHAGPRH